MVYVHSRMGDGAPGEVDPGALGAAVVAQYAKVARDAARYHGPYRIVTTIPGGIVGSEVTATAQATTAQLAATAHLPGVTAAAGPFPETTITAKIPVQPPPGQSGPPGGGFFQTQLTVVGRPSPAGPVDDLTLESGHWPTQPGACGRALSTGLCSKLRACRRHSHAPGRCQASA